MAMARAAAMARTAEAGRLKALSWLPARASAAAATVRPRRSRQDRCGPVFSSFAVCDHTLCRCHAHSATGIVCAATAIAWHTGAGAGRASPLRLRRPPAAEIKMRPNEAPRSFVI